MLMLYALLGAMLLVPSLAQNDCENKDYKSKIGLNFRIHCESNAAGNDIKNTTSSSLANCMESCSQALPGSQFGACRGVSYNVDTRRCYQKDGNVTSTFTFSNNTITALADAEPFQPNPDSSPCPNGNETVHTDDNGMEYTVLCGLYWSGNNYDPGRTGEGAYQPFHADTLTDCMNYCSENAPLCYGVRWTHSSEEYYRNCWPKKANITHSSSKVEGSTYTIAAVGRFQVNSTCTGSSKIYTASNQATFTQSCDTSGDGPDIENVHTSNYEECMDRCANYEDSEGGNTQCSGILYQPNAQQGFRNCYLKYALSNVTSQANWHMATLASRGQPSTEAEEGKGGGEGGEGEKSKSKAWIAGAVAGPVVGIAAIGGLVFWFRRRKAAKNDGQGLNTGKHGGTGGAESMPSNNSSASPGYYAQDFNGKYKYDSAGMTPPPPFSAQPQPPPVAEMPHTSREVKELSGAGIVRHELQS